MEEFKRLKQHLNYLNKEYSDKFDIMYIGMFQKDKKYTTIAFYLPKAFYILSGKSIFNTKIALIDNFNIKLENINDSFEIKLIDIRNLDEYIKTEDIKKLLRSPYRIINKDYKKNIIKILDNIYLFLGNRISELVQIYIKNQMKWVDRWDKNAEQYKDLNEHIKKYNNIFVTSDLHLFHENVLKYESKRLQLLKNYLIGDDYESMIIKHNQILINNYNSIVGKEDLCFILGDFSLGNARETEEVLKQMNGEKILITGNHDTFLKDKSFNRNLFLDIKDYLEININGQGVILSHYPILHFKKQDYDKGNIHLYGHIHTAEIHKPYHSFHIGVDVNQYKPITIQYAIEQAKLETTNQTRYNKKEI